MTSHAASGDTFPGRVDSFVGVLSGRAAHTPDRRAFSFLHRDGAARDDLTYAELDARARSVAVRLTERGLTGQRVLVLLPPGLDYVAAFLGCLYAGSTAVPLYPPPAGRVSARHAAVFADAGAAGAILPTADDKALAPYLDGPNRPLVFGMDGDLPDPGAWRPPAVGGDAVAFLQYTSGSTGKPRGVMITHRNLMANSRQIHRRFGTSPDTPVVSWLPPYHDMGLIGGILQPLYCGAPATLMSPVAFVTDPVLWLRTISRERAAISGGPNFAYDLCVDRIRDEDLSTLDLSTWQVAFNGAEPVRAHTLRRFAKRMAPNGFRARSYLPCYGLAEATLLVAGRAGRDDRIGTAFEPDSVNPGRIAVPVADGDGVELVGSGAIADGVHVRIVDPESGEPCEPGQVGEIQVAGENVAAGYWGQPEETAHTFRAGPDGAHLRTGDLGFLLDGELHVTGRSKDLIIVRGRNHYPHDLELAAEQAHRLVRPGAAAFAVQVDGREELALVLEVSRAAQEDYRQVVTAVRTALGADHGIAPVSLLLVRRGAIPRTTSGKVQRSLCREYWEQGRFTALHRWDATGAVEPVAGGEGPADVRDRVLEIVSARLGATVDPALPLVAQGLDSLAAIEVRAAVAREVGLDLELEDLIAGASVDALLDSAPEAVAPDTTPAPRPTAGPAPLSVNQQALWFLEQQNPGTAMHNLSVALRLLGPVDARALRTALQAVVDRHPVLRTALVNTPDGPRQEVVDDQPVDFSVENAAALDEDELRARLRQQADRAFDLSEGRPLRAVLLRRADGDILCLVAHHVAMDLWSMAVVAKELGALYGGNAALPPLATDYRELTERHAARLAGPHGTRLWDYWRTELDGCHPVLDLPTDRPRPRLRSFRGDTVALRLDPDLTAGLRGIAEDTGTTLFAVLLSVFQTLVRRYTGKDDFLVGTPTSGRLDPDSHPVVGYFVNPVVLRARLAGDRAFTDQVAVTGRTVAGAVAHQDMPFLSLVDRVGFPREADRSAGYQVVFTLNTLDRRSSGDLNALQTGRGGARLDLGGLAAESVELRHATSPVDLTMMFTEVDDHLDGYLNFAVDLFDRSTAERIGEHFAELARRVVAAPGTALDDLVPAPPAEQRDVARWNDTAVPYEHDRSLAALFAEQVARTPDAPALSFGDTAYTYRELDRASTALAHELRARGVGPETIVALRMDRDAPVVVATLAVTKAGGGYLPIDPAHPAHRVEQILTEADPVLVLVHGQAEDGDRPLLDVTPFLTSTADPAPLDDLAGPDTLLYVMYTSGSSGAPKGIGVTHRNVARLVRNNDYVRLEPGDRVAQVSNPAFDAATFEIWGALLNGAHLVGLARDTVLSPRELGAALRARDIHTMFLTTALFVQAVGHDPDTFASLRRLLVGGEVMDLKRMREHLAHCGPTATHVYGPTESTTFATAHRVEEVPDRLARLPIGGPIANTTVHVLDERMRPQPVGVPGEIHLGGDGVARGYLGRPELTADRFVPDPFGTRPGARLYRTGDVGRRLPDGTVDFLGRVDFQVKIRGFRIELLEIDTHLLAHPDVDAAITVVDGDTPETKRILGYYSGARAPQAAELDAYLRERVPNYMVPAVLVRVDELPVNTNGKIDRDRLPAPRAVAHAGAHDDGDTPVLREVLALMRELLNNPDVRADDNFFTVGGHSLLAFKLATTVRERYGVELPLNELFESPTADAVARHVTANAGDPARRSTPAGPTRRARRTLIPTEQ